MHRRAPIPRVAGILAEGGQSLVEFALLLPLLLLLVFGTFTFGQVFVSYLVVVESAHLAAREASTGTSATQAATDAQTAASNAGLNGADLSVDVSGTQDGNGNWVPGTAVTAASSYPVPIVVPLFWPLLGQSLKVQSSVTMMEEG